MELGWDPDIRRNVLMSALLAPQPKARKKTQPPENSMAEKSAYFTYT